MTEVLFFDRTDDALLQCAVVAARYGGRWAFCRRKENNGFRLAGGRRRDGENIEETARRELYEETGAARFRLVPVCPFAIRGDTGVTYGMLYFAEVQEFFAPDPEAERIGLFDGPPENLTDPQIQSRLLRKAAETAGP